jgi:acetyltransferase-like isoleucine patch superfamily enzyme
VHEEMDKQFETYLSEKRNEMWDKHNRVLPTNELLFDRWKKAKMLSCGENSSVYDSSVIMGNVVIGKNVWVGPFTVLEGINGKLTIEDYCMISSGVQIFTHHSVKYTLSGGKMDHEKGDVHIGRNTYIGGMTLIDKGITIGHHCVIGANSFVNKSIPDYSIAFGSPAKVVGKVIVEGDDVRLEYFNSSP